MFTIRLYRTRDYNPKAVSEPCTDALNGQIDDKATECRFISAKSFDAYMRPTGSTAIIVDEVEYNVGSGPNDYDVCYIENSAGKTIDAHRPG